jgi:hypothetical protein
MQSEAKLRSAMPYVLSLGLGALVAKQVPPWLLLPVFFGCLAGIAILAVAAHRIPTPPQLSGGKKFAAVVLTVLLGSGVTVARRGPAPQAFLIALLFMLGFVLALAMPSSAA